jgi:aryl-alcohol dehydrogenase-like predicted oxidoreductase
MTQRTIAGRSVGALGLGCMGMSFAYGATPEDLEESLQVLRRSLELGVNHWDTADLYGAGENEKILAKVLPEVRDQVFLATKFGNVTNKAWTSHQDLVARGDDWIVDGTPEYARKSIDGSLQRLGVDHVDLYYLHRVDDRVPIEETVGAMAEFVREGKVKAIGISEVTAETLRRAHAVHPIAAVQNEFSLWTRDFEHDVLPATKELGVAFVPYSPLGRGFLTGEIKSLDDLAADDWRRTNPRFQGENFQRNLDLVAVVKRVAERKGATPAQIALAWVLASGENVVPIPGTKRLKRLEENAAAADLTLDASDLEELNSVPAPTGERYPEGAMQFVAR